MKLTPAILEASYDFLRATPPFSRWKLPTSKDVEFRVVKQRDRLGAYHGYVHDKDRHTIDMCGARLSHTSSLILIMAHEMAHLHQRQNGTETNNAQHNADFFRLAELICKHHGFDPKFFI